MTSTSAWRAIAVATTLGILAAGCSEPAGPADSGDGLITPGPCVGVDCTPPPSPEATPDPCQLVTVDEVSAATGEQFTVATEQQQPGLPGQRTCIYEISTQTSGLVSVAVWPYLADQVPGFRSQAGMVTDLDGIGEVAFGEPTSGYVYARGYMVSVAILALGTPPDTGPVAALLTAAVDRLP